MNEPMKIWNKVKTPPAKALKEIKGGRLKGFTDIDPMWRFEIMTEVFGQVGIGWTYEILKQWTETPEKDALTETQDICAFTNIQLKYRIDSETDDWSEWIPGTGGSKLAARESKGIHISDECYKMSLTDALSVAMKAIGIGADVYQGKLSHNGSNGAAPQTKYSAQGNESEFPPCPSCGKNAIIKGKKDYGGGYLCFKKKNGCGAKFKTLDAITDPGGERIATLTESISRAEGKFKKAGFIEEFKKTLDTAKVDHADQITDEQTAKDVLDKLVAKVKVLKIEDGISEEKK